MPTEQELKQLYDALPENTKDLLSSPDTAHEVKRLATKYSLNMPDTEMLLNETGLVLLGIEDRSTFADDLIEVLGMGKEQANLLAGELSDSIFSQAKIPTIKLSEEDLKDKSGENPQETKNIQQVLRENSKTTSIRNLVANLK